MTTCLIFFGNVGQAFGQKRGIPTAVSSHAMGLRTKSEASPRQPHRDRQREEKTMTWSPLIQCRSSMISQTRVTTSYSNSWEHPKSRKKNRGVSGSWSAHLSGELWAMHEPCHFQFRMLYLITEAVKKDLKSVLNIFNPQIWELQVLLSGRQRCFCARHLSICAEERVSAGATNLWAPDSRSSEASALRQINES